MLETTRDSLDLVRRLNAFAFAPATPEELRGKLQTIPGVDADKISSGREILYAHRDLLAEEGLIILGQLAYYAVYSGWSGDNANGRCEKIVEGVRRDLKEKGDWIAREDDPEPQTSYREGAVDWRKVETA